MSKVKNKFFFGQNSASMYDKNSQQSGHRGNIPQHNKMKMQLLNRRKHLQIIYSGGQSQDGRGVGRGDLFLSHTLIKRSFEC